MRKRFNFQFLLGQSLIEVVVSIAIAAILAISLISTTLITQRTSQSAKNNTEATKLAQEAIEQLRIIRDRKGFGALQVGNCKEIGIDPTTPPEELDIEVNECKDHGSGKVGELIVLSEKNTTSFYRYISINELEPNKKLIKVTVVWDEPGGEQKVEHETFFTSLEEIGNL